MSVSTQANPMGTHACVPYLILRNGFLREGTYNRGKRLYNLKSWCLIKNILHD